MPRSRASRETTRETTGERLRDRGAMLVFTSLVGVGLCAAVTLALVPVLASLVDRQQAQSAADAAALAGVIGGRSASADLAAENGAALIAWSRSGYEVTVVVRVRDHTATARATDEP